MNLVSLLILPTVITLRHNPTARFTIAGVALVILVGAIAFSKRATGSIAGAEEEPSSGPVEPTSGLVEPAPTVPEGSPVRA